MSKTDQILEYIRTNRVSTTEVADCLGKKGNIVNVGAVNRGHFQVGKVYWVYAYGESNWHVHEQLRNVPDDSIVVVSVFDCGDRAIIGDIIAKFALLYRKCRAIVVEGPVRDANRIIKENWPVWCTGFNPVGCFNTDVEVPELPEIEIACKKFTDAIAVCDDTGVVIIESHEQDEALLQKLEFIEAQEDIWYDCIDRLKWDTYDTICLKKYVNK